MTELEVKVKRLPHGIDLPLPEYQSALASGCDLAAAIDAEILIAPGEWAAMTGLAIALPPGTKAQVRPRSGLAARGGLTVLNAFGA
jgi:dUTP pyrophosphatase